MSKNVRFEVSCDELEISLAITNYDLEQWFDLFEVVYCLTNKKEFIGLYNEKFDNAIRFRVSQMERLSGILLQYLEEIIVFFGEVFEHNKNIEKIEDSTRGS